MHRVHRTVGIGLTASVLAEQAANPSLIAVFRKRAVWPSRQRGGALYAAYVAGDDRAFDAESVVDTLLAGLRG